MKLKKHHIQMGEQELTNAKFLLQDIQKRTRDDVVSEDDKLIISTISEGLIQWLNGFIKQIELGKGTEENDIHN